jgi:hypothetical protein
MRLDTRYISFELFLEMPKLIKKRMAVTCALSHTPTSRTCLCTLNAELEGRITSYRALEYTAFILFSAYTGQRSMATVATLTVKQFRKALASEEPIIYERAIK